MGRFRDLTGQKFGRLTVVERSGTSKHNKVLWKCTCDCGKIKHVVSGELINSSIRSCGCLQLEVLIKRSTKHGQANRNRISPEHSTWHAIKQRCGNPNHIGYKNYGARGIDMAPEWKESFEQFYKDMGPRPSSNHSIERIDNSRGYSKDNCVWASTTEQARNQRVRTDNKVGVRGVGWRRDKKKYFAFIYVNGKRKCKGNFDSVNEAAEARKYLENKYWGKSS